METKKEKGCCPAFSSPAINIPSQDSLSNGTYLLIQFFWFPASLQLYFPLHFSSADGTRNSLHHFFSSASRDTASGCPGSLFTGWSAVPLLRSSESYRFIYLLLSPITSSGHPFRSNHFFRWTRKPFSEWRCCSPAGSTSDQWTSLQLLKNT